MAAQAAIYFQDNYYPDVYAFLRASRYIVYLLMFIVMGDLLRASRVSFRSKKPQNMTLILVAAFTSAYIFLTFILGRERPALYSENNFEVPSLLLLIALFFSSAAQKKSGRRAVILGVLVSVLSKSKSGILEAITLVFRFFVRTVSPKTIGISVVLLLMLLPVVLFIFQERMQGQSLYELDRFRFLSVFWNAMLSSTAGQVAFGHGLASVLSFADCIELQFWAEGISTDFSYCDSAVFHSFFMRLVYDIGVIGAAVFLSGWFYFARFFFGKRIGLTALMIVSICSLSVSGFSNSIVIWPLFLALFYQPKQ